MDEALKQLARKVHACADHADKAWGEPGKTMAHYIAQATAHLCKPGAEAELVNLLLTACWNDALGWAESNAE